MKILYLLFAVFFLVAQSTEVADRGIIGTSVCVSQGGVCLPFGCPLYTMRIGRCGLFWHCCKCPKKV
uniref:As-beta-defensin-3 n=1 Tax=Apalone spinifera TaxID=55534 RepID=A0A0A1HAZ6_APASP|nr:As-beta-defensin-3 [Apalone spinifera]